MFNRIPSERFSGYPAEDAERFLSNFKAYASFSNLETYDRRQAASFQLHLERPAQSWFASLENDITCHWDSLCGAFRQKYISSDNRPILLVETEHFMNLRLLPHQQIENYYSKIMDNGRQIHKTAKDILLKFIEGLPPQLAFFVRARNPEDIQAALTASKLGEAYGYRASLPSSSSFTTTQHHQNKPIRTTLESTEPVPSVPVHNVCAAQSPVGDRMSRLEQRLDSLCNQIQKLNTDSKENQSWAMPSCHSCQGRGHFKRDCNLASGSSDPSVQCQLCVQFGHTSINCRKYQRSGNERCSMGHQARPLERTVRSRARTLSVGRRNTQIKRNTPCASAFNSIFHDSKDMDKDTASVGNNNFLYVHVQFPNSNVSALLDLGSSIILMSKQFYESLPSNVKSTLSPLPGDKIILANNQEIHFCGLVQIQATVNKAKHNLDVYVIEETSHPLLLGVQYLKQHGIKLDFSSKTIQFTKCKIYTKK